MPKVASKINIVDFNAEVEGAIEEVVVEEVVEPVKVKAKAKGKAKAVIAWAEEPLTEIAVPEVEVAPEPKALEPTLVSEPLVACVKCGKKMKAKTLQYSHKCPMDKAVVEKPVEPVKPVAKEILRTPPKPIKVEKEQVDYSSIPEEVFQAEINKRASLSKHTKTLKKQESIKKLSQNIA